jgi:hypothetical protein
VIYAVLVIEKRRDGEPPLSVAEQVNEVVGPFEHEEDALGWADLFLEGAAGNFACHVTPVTSPGIIASKPPAA